MKTYISLFMLLSINLLFAQYFQTTTSATNVNQNLTHQGRIILGHDFDSGNQLQVYKNSATNVNVLIGNTSGRLEMGLAQSAGWYSNWASPGDAVIRLLTGKNLNFHMPNNNMMDPGSDTSTPLSPGITRIRFSDMVNKNSLVIFNTGKVTMGTELYDDSGYRLFVKDGIKTEKIKVEIASANGWADHVFEEDYNLMSLDDLESFIDENKHLPNIPSTNEVLEEGGVELKDMTVKLLEKVEELTLYMLQQQEEIKKLNTEIELLKSNQK